LFITLLTAFCIASSAHIPPFINVSALALITVKSEDDGIKLLPIAVCNFCIALDIVALSLTAIRSS
jgi:hypothetical protein